MSEMLKPPTKIAPPEREMRTLFKSELEWKKLRQELLDGIVLEADLTVESKNLGEKGVSAFYIPEDREIPDGGKDFIQAVIEVLENNGYRSDEALGVADMTNFPLAGKYKHFPTSHGFYDTNHPYRGAKQHMFRIGWK